MTGASASKKSAWTPGAVCPNESAQLRGALAQNALGMHRKSTGCLTPYSTTAACSAELQALCFGSPALQGTWRSLSICHASNRLLNMK